MPQRWAQRKPLPLHLQQPCSHPCQKGSRSHVEPLVLHCPEQTELSGLSQPRELSELKPVLSLSCCLQWFRAHRRLIPHPCAAGSVGPCSGGLCWVAVGAHAWPQLSLVAVKPGPCSGCWSRCWCSVSGCWCRSRCSPGACVWLWSLSLLPGAAGAVALLGMMVSAPATSNSGIPGGHRAVGLGPLGCLPCPTQCVMGMGTGDLP